MSAKICPNYIGGQWVEGPLFENRNPADTSDIVGLHVAGIPEDIDRAAAAAQAALPAWSALNGPARGALLYKVADLLEQRFDEISAEVQAPSPPPAPAPVPGSSAHAATPRARQIAAPAPMPPPASAAALPPRAGV